MGKELQGHVRAAPGAVDREEAQARAGQAVQMAVGVGHELVALLGRGVERDRRVDAVLLAEGYLLVAAVDGARARVHQVLHRVVAAGLQDVEEADQVAVDVG